MQRSLSQLRLPFLLLVTLQACIEPLPAVAAPPLFERDVLPILTTKCGNCHGGQVRKADLSLQDMASLVRGGESGSVITPGEPAESLLFEFIRDGAMPPEGEPSLSAQQMEIIRAWIESGAHSESPTTIDKSATYIDIVPLMLRRCVMCHGPEYQFGGLDVRGHEKLLRGGESGPALVAGDVDGSRMVRRVIDQQCPPAADIGESGIEPMTAAELQLLKDWISSGAPSQPLVEDVAGTEPDPLVTDAERQHWSFVPPKKLRPPIFDSVVAPTAIDAFILERQRAAGLTFSPAARRITLARRAAYMLTGLPPDESQLKAFLQDRSPHAWKSYVEQLLNSPRYGEKWGRFWLDLAGYADSEGKRSADAVRPFAWKYRDWVIRAFQRDMPYNEFLIHQLAGDELVDWADADHVTADVVSKLTATGFLRMVPDGTAADPVNRFSDRMEVISDAIDVLSRSVMGLTMNCARCHSHKYDPIPQRDYYRMVAVFKGAYDEYDWLTPHAFNNQWKNSKQRLVEVATPEDKRAAAEHRKDVQRRLDAVNRMLKQKGLSSAEQRRLKEQQRNLTGELQTPKIRALWDRGRPSPTFIYRRGDETQPGLLVGPGVPSVLTDGRTPFQPVSLSHTTPKTGRRLAFARWLTSEDHPLTARVFVNRIWQQHFGRGIVESVDNFGKLGTPPSHPELLDWLAVDFVEHGWSVKRLHRQIMNTVVWRQDSRIADTNLSHDPDNRLLSRMPMRRLTAEEVRDTLLLISGRLNEEAFGEPDAVEVRNDGLVTSKPLNGKWRRSIYVRQRRKEMPTLFVAFDVPQMTPNCTIRATSTVVTQPLLLLNNRMVRDLADAFADRVRSEAGPEESSQLVRAFEIAFGRVPTKEENDALLYAFHGIEVELAAVEESSSESQPREASPSPPSAGVGETVRDTSRSDENRSAALANVCHGLMNSASLIYVD